MKVTRSAATLALVLALLAAPLTADAQQAAKVPRIGILPPGPISERAHLWEAFRQGLRELGYVEGQNITLVFPSGEVRPERLPHLAAELVRLQVDIIVAPTTGAALVTREATRTIPIVFVVAADPVASRLVASLARPGGNVTGLTLFAGTEIVGKYLELLREAVPRTSRMAVLWNPANPPHPSLVREAESAARSLGLRLQAVGARGPDEFDGAFAAMTRERAEALVVLTDPMFFTQRTRLAELVAKSRLPAMFGLKEHVEAGGLMAYASSLPDLYRRAASVVGKILKGAKPADLPVEQPTRFELVLNLKTAKALGLTFPQSVLIRADEVIE